MAQLEAVSTTIPGHVPPNLIVDFDFYHVAPGYRDFHEVSGALVSEAPAIFYTGRNGGHWVVTKYDLVSKIARDAELFGNVPYTIPTFAGEPKLAPGFTDPPEHTHYRRALSGFFTPGAAVALKDAIRARTIEVIDDVVGHGGCDFVASVAEVLPVSIVMDLLGLPRERLREYRKYIKQALGSPDPDGKRLGFSWCEAEMRLAIAERAERPRGDMISRMFEVDMGDGRKPTRDEILNLCMMLFVAGLDTVTLSMAYGIRHLAEDQALQTRLREEPALVEAATEELLRRYSVVQTGRTVARDVELEGITLKKGDRMLLLTAAADLDPSAYPDPMTVDFERARRPHLAFLAGPHRCIGMHLARVELQILYEEWLARLPAFRVDPTVPQRFGGGHVLAILNLSLRWD
jgi:cytochrome P450